MAIYLAEIKEFLNITDNESDTILENLEDRIFAEMEAYCNQSLGSGSNVFTGAGSGSQFLSLPSFPVNSFSEVLESTDITFASSTDITSDCTLVEIDNVKYIYNENGFSVSSFYKVTYDAGYSTLPNDIVDIIVQLTSELFLKSFANTSEGEKGRLGLVQLQDTTLGTAINTTLKDLRKEQFYKLNKYRNHVGNY